MGVYAALDVVFGFLLSWPPIVAILSVSLVVSLVIVVSYKFLTDQAEMKRLKDEVAASQKMMKEHKDNPEKMLAAQKQAMALNMQYMTKSMKPTLFTFLPIILVFGWMSAHFAFEPLLPQQDFTLTTYVNAPGNVSLVVPEGLSVVGDSMRQTESRDVSSWFGLVKGTENKAVFTLKGDEGKHLVTVQSGGEEKDAEVIITTERRYADVSQAYTGDVFEKVELGNQPLIVFWKVGWLGTYIIAAIVLSTVLRKLLRVY